MKAELPTNPEGFARKSTLVVIPARDEAETVGHIVSKVLHQGFPVVVVDDASRDGTGTVARDAGARVISLPFTTGAWIAMQTGIRYALMRGYGQVVTLDADGQHDPNVIDTLLKPGRPPLSPNVVIGSYCDRGSLGRQIAWRILRLLGGIQVNDLTSGYRAYDHSSMKIVASGAATLLEYQDVGVLLLLMEHGMILHEVETPMAPRLEGKSRIFHSWFRVIYYLLSATLLCTSKARKGLPRN